MRHNTVIRQLDAGGPVYGVVLGLGSPGAARALGGSGVDFGVIDAQHGNWDLDRARGAYRALADGGIVPMVRVAENSPVAIGSMLDRGALGIIVPMVESVADAEAAAAATRYPPDGERSIGGSGLRRWLSIPEEEINQELFLAVQIESSAGLARCEEILAVDGIDGCWVGTSDLGRSMGIDPSTESGHRALGDAIDRIHDACMTTDTVPGIATPGPNDEWLATGYRFVTIGSDGGFLNAGAAAGVDRYAH